MLILIVIAAVAIGVGVIFAAVQNSKPETTNNMDSSTELKIEDVKVGTGAAVKAGDTITVHYTGTFADGTKFDSSLDRGEPFVFEVGGPVIQGWNEGVLGMQAGGTRKLVVPPALGYGANDYGPIPGNSTLYFTIELFKIGE